MGYRLYVNRPRGGKVVKSAIGSGELDSLLFGRVGREKNTDSAFRRAGKNGEGVGWCGILLHWYRLSFCIRGRAADTVPPRLVVRLDARLGFIRA